MKRLITFLTLVVLLLTACGGGGQPASPAGTAVPVILTSTTFLADITRNIAGDRATVESLLPIGADPHAYQPTPQDAAKIAQSELLIINGAEYEHFLESLLENAGGARTILEASAGVSRRAEAGNVDPHMWLDPNNVIRYAENIRDGLIQFDPAGAETYRSNADDYILQLAGLNAWILDQVSLIPEKQRLLVTNHEALGYFAAEYRFTLIGTVVESFSSGASPSAQQMAGLIDQINASGAPAIFLDAADSPALAQQIAAETGAQVVTDLYLESLTEGPPAATYLDMMKHNVTQIVNALR